MDVLRPPLINIKGRIYRRNIIQEEHNEEVEEEDLSYTGPLEGDEFEDEACDAHVIEQTNKGFRCAFDVPSVLYKYIIGKKGETRRRLECDTKTSISIPKQGVEGQIVITGSHRASVSSAATRIEVLTESFRKKQPFTHFLSFPLNGPEIQEGFLRFKEDVLKQCSQDHGVEESIFQNPAKLHLTIGTFALLNEKEVKKAGEHLRECENVIRDLTEGKPLQLEVTGIEYMNDDPAMVDVLYAKVDVTDRSDRWAGGRRRLPFGSSLSFLREVSVDADLASASRLQVIAGRLAEHFVAAGLMVRERERVKLHGTVMNTLFRRDSSVEDAGGPGRRTLSEREAFDARNILKRFGAHRFGAFRLNSVLLSTRYSSDCTGYYASAGSITFS
ncbi:activating signal cointegrator 1 complex subunit 1 isoform X1 [Brachionichthys hirsutus]|uniref:activating signal cointegrator 1 complex subunit 1 isoform X1 n=1 Tax=Brachionichthys hirsutus TaxID=412623 RepID=UPI00360493F8